MIAADVTLDRAFAIGDVDPRLFGSFVEHLGRCVYDGIYEPGHPQADAEGFRQDVLDLVRELGVTMVRYPGGNFVSGYNWEDGVGPREARPRRIDLAWRSTETNQIGTNEFMSWCKKAAVEPMLAVNLGTRGPLEAAQYLEYCNIPGGTTLSDQRRTDGADVPHRVKFWCLGNEMDGPWQTGQTSACDYGVRARETAKAMRAVDGEVILAACGSSGRDMATFGAWEYDVLDACFDHVDFISIHVYFRDTADDQSHFLTSIDMMDAYIGEVIAIADAVAAKRRSSKRIMLSFDEWNVWYKARTPEHQRQPGFPVAPRLLEEIYDMQDALVVGGALITLINHCDRVKAACLAQLVNVIAPIMTEPGGPAWRQTIFHPFAETAKRARGVALRAAITSPMLKPAGAEAVPALCLCAIHDTATDRLTMFALNRDPQSDMQINVDLRGFVGRWQAGDSLSLHHADRHAVNTREAPNTVVPLLNDTLAVAGDRMTAVLPPASWNLFVLSGSGRPS